MYFVVECQDKTSSIFEEGSSINENSLKYDCYNRNNCKESGSLNDGPTSIAESGNKNLKDLKTSNNSQELVKVSFT